jgi:hypothetical protein
MPAARVPTLVEVDQIVALADPVVRNLQITQCYHELAAVLAERTGLNANWCSFATWASNQAGRTIRKEDLTRALAAVIGADLPADEVLRSVLAWAATVGVRPGGLSVQQLLWEAWDPQAAFEHASDAVARGNRKVFDEIGRAFARFYAVCLNDSAFDAEHLAGFLQDFRTGPPPEGQDYLRRAFTRYYQALFEPDLKARVELLLLANLEIGYHEQTRLQPEILEALDAPIPNVAAFKRRLAAALLRQGNGLALVGWVWSRLQGRPTPLDVAAEHYASRMRAQARLITTEFLMTLELPGGVRLRLGSDLTAEYPPILQHLTNSDLLALLAQIDPTPDSRRGTGAADWAALPQRLHFILDMLRCYEATPALLEPPFTSAQVAVLKAGRRPDGPF